MPEAVTVALITVAGALLTLIIQNIFTARRTGRVERVVEVVREQVQNGHGTNLRDEQDARHQTNAKTLTENSRKLDDILDDLRVVREHQNMLWRRSDAHTRQLDELDERTQPVPRSRFEPRTARHINREDTQE